MRSYYTVTKVEKNKYRFSLVAGNHEIILTSEDYTTEVACFNGINSVRKHCSDRSNYVVDQDRLFFMLRAKNHVEIGRSQLYSSMQDLEKGIEAVMRAGATHEFKVKKE